MLMLSFCLLPTGFTDANSKWLTPAKLKRKIDQVEDEDDSESEWELEEDEEDKGKKKVEGGDEDNEDGSGDGENDDDDDDDDLVDDYGAESGEEEDGEEVNIRFESCWSRLDILSSVVIPGPKVMTLCEWNKYNLN